ncbi:hypothetical protein OCGS_1682 [Oceaniovalibus guishaninsula JLT2003]|uniref:Uncharacterized protein n=2 Tax=Oceaniovalibus TaxID=1207070 RepID=K2GNH4_9RHOB|nr:hypothetical protein OCGS_1682 [Oceaniovalibus guishaninsula JLT2003]
MNIHSPVDYAPGQHFIDMMKNMRAWQAHKPGVWDGLDQKELQKQGYLDADGWVKEIPPGMESVGTIFSWQYIPEENYRLAGRYVLEYEGEGTITIGATSDRIKIVSREPGKIVFEANATGKIFLRITETDPEKTGDYIRNMTMVHEDKLDLFEAGAVFDPVYLETLKDLREIRFMGVMGANNSKEETWDERATPDGPNMGRMSVEDMVRLANEVGADPWFTIPHRVDETWIRNFAEYVRDNLDDGLVAKFEYSNEIWNWGFWQTQELLWDARVEWAGYEGQGGFFPGYVAKRATEVAALIKEVFGEENADRVHAVLGTQTANIGFTQQMLESKLWKQIDPEGFIDPASVFDSIGVTTYFGNSTVGKAAYRDELLKAIADPNVDAFQYLADKLMDPNYESSIPFYDKKLAIQKQFADKYGLDLVAYEGGQHVHHAFGVRDLTAEQKVILTEFMGEFMRSPQMADLYQASWDSWMKYGDGPYMQFLDITMNSVNGMWGLYESTTDHSPRSDLLEKLNAETAAWWDEDGGQRYQHGVIERGTEGDDSLIGTDKIDYLLGGGGDDAFTPGKGDDGINGGDGIDRVILSEAIGLYTLVAEGEGYRLTGPDGTKYLVGIELLQFAGGPAFDIAEFADRRAAAGEGSGGDTQMPPPPDPKPEPKPEPEPEPEPEPGDGNTGGGNSGGDGDASAGGDDGAPVDPGGPDLGLTLTMGLGDGVVAATPDTVVQIEGAAGSQKGVFIMALHSGGGTAREMGQSRGEWAHSIFEMGATAEFDGRTVEASYWSLNDDVAEKGGDPLTGSALDTALSFGAIVQNVGEITATDRGDRFFGREEASIVHGRAGNDWLFGGAGEDALFGDDGRDSVIGGSGNDTIDGGAGNDRLIGQAGSDTFVFGKGSGRDDIIDFAAEDRLYLGDLLQAGQTLADVASEKRGGLVLSFGDEKITFKDLDGDDLAWLTETVITDWG